MTPNLEIQKKAVQYGLQYEKTHLNPEKEKMARATFDYLTINEGIDYDLSVLLAKTVTKAVFARMLEQPAEADAYAVGGFGGDLDFIGTANGETARLYAETQAEEDVLRLVCAKFASRETPAVKSAPTVPTTPAAPKKVAALKQKKTAQRTPAAPVVKSPERPAQEGWGPGQPWRQPEMDSLAVLFKVGRPIKVIAKAHNRSEGAIRAQLLRQGLMTEEEREVASEAA